MHIPEHKPSHNPHPHLPPIDSGSTAKIASGNEELSNHQEKHINSGQYLKSAVYGGLDGLINTLSVVLGGVGSGNSSYKILALGVSVLIGDGIGMALGDYLSSKSENDYVKAEEAREMWEVQNKLEDERKEMEDLYVQKGYSQAESKRLAELISHNPEAFVNIMMLEELGLAPEDGSPVINGIVTLFSFILFGLFPLLPYIIDRATNSPARDILIGSLVSGGFLLFVLGFVKAILIGTNKWKSGILSLLLGAAAVAIGYGIGVGLEVPDDHK